MRKGYSPALAAIKLLVGLSLVRCSHRRVDRRQKEPLDGVQVAGPQLADVLGNVKPIETNPALQQRAAISIRTMPPIGRSETKYSVWNCSEEDELSHPNRADSAPFRGTIKGRCLCDAEGEKPPQLVRSGGRHMTIMSPCCHGYSAATPNVFHVFFIYTQPLAKLIIGRNFSAKFETFIASLWRSVQGHRRVILHAMVDEGTERVVLASAEHGCQQQHLEAIFIYPKNVVQSSLLEKSTFGELHRAFANSSNEYYNDVLFMMGAYLHRIIPASVKRIIAIDIDTKIAGDLAELWAHFDHFPGQAVFGLALEQGPVYRFLLEDFRKRNRNTPVGEPPSNGGWTGYNSGVMLADLNRMRASSLYADLLKPTFVNWLMQKYSFSGHLGDQDFYTLLSFEDIGKELIYTLPCSWNRQLCVCFEPLFPDVFNEYHRCDEEVKIYHGNCNTPIPK